MVLKREVTNSNKIMQSYAVQMCITVEYETMRLDMLMASQL